MSRTPAPVRQPVRIVHLRSRRIFAISIALGLALAGGIPTAQAEGSEDPPPPPVLKDYVCKYIGTPGVDESLQTGNNPIWVATAATTSGWVTPGLFNDAHRSFVIVADSPKLTPEPGLGDCGQPQGPPAEVVVTTEHATTCAEYKVRDITVTTPYVWKDDKWVLGTADAPVVGAWSSPTPPTDKQIKDAGLFCTSQPDARVVVTPEHATTCTEYSVRDATVTTPYVLNAKGDKWVLGTAGAPVVGAWSSPTPPTDKQIKAAGLTCPPPVDNPPVDNPVVVTTETSDGVQIEAAQPVVVHPPVVVTTESSDGVQIAAVHPLPSAARAGEASTGGQLTAGGFAALAALLAFGAAFVLRRRHGDA